jgi:hypothetical protein
MVASEYFEIDARMHRVVAHSVSPCPNYLIFMNVQLLHNAGHSDKNHRLRLNRRIVSNPNEPDYRPNFELLRTAWLWTASLCK